MTLYHVGVHAYRNAAVRVLMMIMNEYFVPIILPSLFPKTKNRAIRFLVSISRFFPAFLLGFSLALTGSIRLAIHCRLHQKSAAGPQSRQLTQS